ncbi:hypothetical protein EVAR_97074_1 [Eumeta japonica]|uniref:Tc1-like transposase DDE domain-containing protein n=1 Tax=Eumeta variegata TaxID=151549 RepID=A0A4C1X4M3_EUMVA|nr:hypothetical protein EVAR_97074_1 [Eumeta japonica]
MVKLHVKQKIELKLIVRFMNFCQRQNLKLIRRDAASGGGGRGDALGATHLGIIPEFTRPRANRKRRSESECVALERMHVQCDQIICEVAKIGTTIAMLKCHSTVKSFFEEEARLQAPIIPFNQIYKRISAATGVSQGLISKIVKEGQAAEEVGTKIRTPGKQRIRKNGFVHVDDFYMGVIRRKVHEFYSAKKEIPTIKKLLETLKTEINYTGQRETLRKLFYKLGFRFKKTKSNRKVLMKRNEVSAWRARYLREVDKNNKSPNPRPLIYLDETYIHSSHTSGKCWQGEGIEGVLEPVSKGQRYIIVHAGGDAGFVKNALTVFKSNTKSGDYHDDMNSANFKKWVIEKLVPNLIEPSIIVMDNAPYHRVCVNKVPNSNA